MADTVSPEEWRLMQIAQTATLAALSPAKEQIAQVNDKCDQILVLLNAPKTGVLWRVEAIETRHTEEDKRSEQHNRDWRQIVFPVLAHVIEISAATLFVIVVGHAFGVLH